MRIAALIRVSSPQQAREDRASLKSQEDYIKHIFATSPSVFGPECRLLDTRTYYGWEKITDPKLRRPILERLLADAEANKFDGVIVADSSRWSRTLEEAREVRARLALLGKHFYEGADLKDPRDLAQMFSSDVKTLLSEHEWKMTRLRTMRSKWTLGSEKPPLWPYGWMPPGRITKDGGRTWTTNPKHPWTKAKAQRAYHYIVERGLGLIPTALKLGMEPRGEVLHKYILNSTRIASYTQENPDTGEVRTVEVDTGIDLLTKEQVDQIKAAWKLKEGGRQPGWRDYVLTGRIRCACGQMMIGTFKWGKRLYVHAPRKREPVTPDCRNSVEADEIEAKALTHIGEQLRDRRKIEHAVVAAMDTSHDRRQRSMARQKDLEQEGEKANKELLRLLMATRAIDLKGAAKAGVQAKVNELNETIERAAAGVEEEKREQAECLVFVRKAARDAERIAYLFKNPAWWRDAAGFKNQRIVLALTFGEGTLRTKPGEGIIVHRDGSWEIKAQTPLLDDASLRTLASKVQPGFVRPRLPKKQQLASTARPTC